MPKIKKKKVYGISVDLAKDFGSKKFAIIQAPNNLIKDGKR